MDLTTKLAEIAKRRGQSSAVGTPLTARTLGRLDAGSHHVRIESVNTSCLATRGFVDLIYGDTQERTHRDRLWVMVQDNQDLSWRLKQLLDALFDNNKQWLAILEQDQEQAFHMLRGMRLEITLGHGPGYQVQQSPIGWQAVDRDKVLLTRGTIEELHTQAKVAGHRRSWLQIKGVTGGRYTDVNQQALNNATVALRAAAEAEPVSLEAHLKRLGAN